MKRVLCLVSAMDAGGAETFLMKLYRKLDTEKYQMDFCVTVNRRCYYDEEIERRGGKIHHIIPKSENVSEFSKQLFNVVKDNGYEYVLRITSTAMGFMDLKIAKKAGARVCAARSSNSSDGGSLKAIAAHKLGRLLYDKYADVKFAPSMLAAEYTFGKKACDSGAVSILPNAIDLSVFKYDINGRKTVRDEFGISDSTLVVGHIGRFSKQKNHSFLLNVFEELHRSNPDSVLMLAGKGELEDEIKRITAEKGLNGSVIFTGVRPDVPQLLSAMDVFIFPSFYEGMPNTVIEAQATGLPCVISDTITKEAAITSKVIFLSLASPASAWSDTALQSCKNFERQDASEIMEAGGYNIVESVRKFEKLIFGE